MSRFHITLRVPWADTDAAAVVWLGNFLKYVEMAEEELFRSLGHPRLQLFAEQGIVMPRANMSMSFRSPARFDDVLDIALGVDRVDEKRVTFVFDISQKDSGRLVVEGRYEVACVDRSTFTSRPFPDVIRTILTGGVRSI